MYLMTVLSAPQREMLERLKIMAQTTTIDELPQVVLGHPEQFFDTLAGEHRANADVCPFPVW